MIISFLASHGGSSARAIIRAIREGELAAEVGIVITNNRDSNIFRWCLDNAVPVHHISSKSHHGEENADSAIHSALQEAGSDLVVLSGYMKKVGATTLAAFPDKILNIHPALLPRHGGQGKYGDHVHAEVLAAGDTESGATVHIINAAYDEGPIILQQSVPVMPGDTVEVLRARVQAVEPDLYIRAVRLMIDKQY